MADPIIPGAVRVLCIQPSTSGLPEDAIVNSLVFVRGLEGGEYDDLADVLQAYYTWTGEPGFRPQALVGPDMEFRFYEMADTPPREPTILERPVPRASAGTALPEEVAITVSYYSERNLPRRRGRMYLGPITSQALVNHDGQVRIRPELCTFLAAKAETLRVSALAAGWLWSVLSTRDAEVRFITSGWVDNAPDTQRRRGAATTARAQFPV